MFIGKILITSVTTMLFLCSQLYFCSEHQVFGYSHVNSTQIAKKSVTGSKKPVKTAKNFIKIIITKNGKTSTVHCSKNNCHIGV